MVKLNLFKEKKKSHNVMYYISYLIYDQNYLDLSLQKLLNNSCIKYVIILSDEFSYYTSMMIANNIKIYCKFIFVYLYPSFDTICETEYNKKDTLCLFIYSTMRKLDDKCYNKSISKCTIKHLFCPFILYDIKNIDIYELFFLESLYFKLLFINAIDKDIKYNNLFRNNLLLLPKQIEKITNIMNFMKNNIYKKINSKQIYIVSLDLDQSQFRWFALKLKKKLNCVTHVYFERKIESNLIHNLCKDTLFILIDQENSVQLSQDLKEMYFILKKLYFKVLFISLLTDTNYQKTDLIKLPVNIDFSYFTILHVFCHILKNL